MFLGLLPMLGHGGLELGNPAPGSRYRTRGEIAVTIGALKVCSGDLERGKMLHLDAIESGIHTHPHVAAALVSMYARCGSLAEAHRVFEEMPRRNVVSWNALIQGYAENGQENLAMKSFVVMQDREGLCPNSQTFVAVLKACTNMATKGERAGDGVSVKEQTLEKGMALHSHATVSGFELNEFVANSLVEMYAKSGSMEDASRVFFRMKSRSVVSWTAMILGFAENGEEELALELFDLMLETQSCRPDALTFVAAIKSCARLAIKEEGRLIGKSLVKVTSLEKGKIVHTRARNSGCQSSIVLESALVDMYSKCGSMVDARRVFDSVKCHNVVSWNSLIQGYVENGEEDLALESLFRMQAEKNCQPDARTFVAAFKACGGLAAKENGKKLDDLPKLVKVESLEKGMALHARLAKSTCGPDVFLTNTLVDMYARCRSMQDSQKAFDQSSHHTTVSWNALILGYAENGEGEAALEFFQQMLAAGECPPDCLTYIAALKACNTVAATEKQLVNGLCSP
ncbi:pentatricopeptide repeat-containing protein At1g03540-like [Selaginella moellendorffii]|uniref:pentatricopeptide repeat-containing protein At1g03540-like n=1 Tax=Selaginella moellendorffii TaxID=88036 RepID=UPI000D1C32D3|nr:pentatricopeptide repeat-containing protein At1g03540-like [Selaginella moellendorffii]|eukprot:XP_024526495.1 pentatricopeptide repeat-containing protein At1g03540-like [Selaginella moellendorffii]